MAEIARRAGVVRATIYVHFPTRESLLDAVMEHAVARGRRGDDATPSRSAASRRKRWSGCSAPPGRSSTGSTLCSRSTPSRLSAKELHRRHLPVTTQLAPLIERGQKAGRLPERPPGLVASRGDPRDRAYRERRAAERPNLRSARSSRDAHHGCRRGSGGEKVSRRGSWLRGDGPPFAVSHRR